MSEEEVDGDIPDIVHLCTDDHVFDGDRWTCMESLKKRQNSEMSGDVKQINLLIRGREQKKNATNHNKFLF